jgi:2-iminobutanoate/2-iminopropanoate deaminase
MLKAVDKIGRNAVPTYSQGVIATGTRTLYVSGQVAIGCEASDGILQQAKVAFQNLHMVLSAADMAINDVAKLTVYLTDAKDVEAFLEVSNGVLPKPRPAMTLLIIKGLAESRYLVEIEAIAIQ